MREFKAYIPEKLPEYPSVRGDIPVDLEIGCGVGLHPILYCQDNPDRQLIAIEHTAEKFQKFLKRSQSHQLDNLYPIHCNAISFLAKYGQPDLFGKVFLLYPNPNPKPGQKNKRWHGMPFMSKIWESLKTGGELCLVTNEEWYFEEALNDFDKVWGYPPAKVTSISCKTHPNWRARTHFESKYLERGQTVFQISILK